MEGTSRVMYLITVHGHRDPRTLPFRHWKVTEEFYEHYKMVSFGLQTEHSDDNVKDGFEGQDWKQGKVQDIRREMMRTSTRAIFVRMQKREQV